MAAKKDNGKIMPLTININVLDCLPNVYACCCMLGNLAAKWLFSLLNSTETILAFRAWRVILLCPHKAGTH